MRPCWRCHTLDTTVTAHGLLWLCASCGVTPACAPFQHRYVGAEAPGCFVCLDCAGQLSSVPITTGVVEAPGTTQYVDC